MHYITVPKSITFTRIFESSGGLLTMSFADYFLKTLVIDPRTRIDLAAIIRFPDICAKVSSTKEGEEFGLMTEDFEWLSNLVRTFEYNNAALPEIYPFLRAIVGAATEPQKSAPDTHRE